MRFSGEVASSLCCSINGFIILIRQCSPPITSSLFSVSHTPRKLLSHTQRPEYYPITLSKKLFSPSPTSRQRPSSRSVKAGHGQGGARRDWAERGRYLPLVMLNQFGVYQKPTYHLGASPSAVYRQDSCGASALCYQEAELREAGDASR